MKFVSFPECSLDYQDYTPCTDPKVRADQIVCCDLIYQNESKICGFLLLGTEVEEVWHASSDFHGAPLPGGF